ncbi:MAG: hypothetical protein WBA25_09270, partial [Jannaschia sp.]
MTMTDPYRASAVGSTVSAVDRVSWGAIFAGGAVSVALMILFTTFGIGIGAAVLDPQYDPDPGSGQGIGSGIYLIVTQLIALGAVCFIAARLAGIPRPVTSALHGAAVWAIATIILAWAAVTGTGAMFGAASTVIGSTADAVGKAGEAVIPHDISLPNPTHPSWQGPFPSTRCPMSCKRACGSGASRMKTSARKPPQPSGTCSASRSRR